MSVCSRGSRSAFLASALLLSCGVLSGCKGGGSGSDASAATPSAAAAPIETAATSTSATTPAASTANGKPTIAGTAPESTVANNPYLFQPSASDPDRDALSFQIENKPAWATFNTVTGELTGTPTHPGTFADIVISASDGKDTATLAPFTIAVALPTRAAESGVSLAWIAPTQTIDGNPLTDLTGFVISYGTSEQTLSHSVFVDNPSVDRFVFEDLEPGTYFFAIQAVTADGSMSGLSELQEKAVG